MHSTQCLAVAARHTTATADVSLCPIVIMTLLCSTCESKGQWCGWCGNGAVTAPSKSLWLTNSWSSHLRNGDALQGVDQQHAGDEVTSPCTA